MPDATYVFEFKIDRSAAEALAQIKEKGYHQPYLNAGRKVVLVGVAFDTTTRTLAGWPVEIVNCQLSTVNY